MNVDKEMEGWKTVSRKKNDRSKDSMIEKEIVIGCKFKSFVLSSRSNGIFFDEKTRDTQKVLQLLISNEGVIWMKNIMKWESKKNFHAKWYWIFHGGKEHILFSRDQNRSG